MCALCSVCALPLFSRDLLVSPRSVLHTHRVRILPLLGLAFSLALAVCTEQAPARPFIDFLSPSSGQWGRFVSQSFVLRATLLACLARSFVRRGCDWRYIKLLKPSRSWSSLSRFRVHSVFVSSYSLASNSILPSNKFV